MRSLTAFLAQQEGTADGGPRRKRAGGVQSRQANGSGAGSAFPALLLLLVLALALGGIAACGAASGTDSGEIIFDFGADDEADSGAEDERHPLPLDGGANPR